MKRQQKFAISGSSVHPFIQQEGSVVEKVPAGYYVIKESMFGFYLQNKSSEIQLPGKIYGNTLERSKRIWDAYNRRDGAMAAGLFGSKGAGKTLLANVIAQQAIDIGLPVIDVSESFRTESAYFEFINSIGNCVIIFDEFIKRLSKTAGDSDDSRRALRERQNDMLTFFQGTHNAKRLVIMIDNEAYGLSEFFRDRPGRMRYNFVYRGITKDIVQQLGEDAELSQDKIDMLITYSTRFDTTFDMVNEIISEWKFNPEETLEEITSIMNVPTLMPTIDTKVRVVKFETLDDNGASLRNEIGVMKPDGTIVVEVNQVNELATAPEMTREQFEKSQYEEDYSYERFKELQGKPFIEDRIPFNQRELTAVRNGQSVYQDGQYKVVIEEMGTTYTSRFNFDDLEML